MNNQLHEFSELWDSDEPLPDEDEFYAVTEECFNCDGGVPDHEGLACRSCNSVYCDACIESAKPGSFLRSRNAYECEKCPNCIGGLPAPMWEPAVRENDEMDHQTQFITDMIKGQEVSDEDLPQRETPSMNPRHIEFFKDMLGAHGNTEVDVDQYVRWLNDNDIRPQRVGGKITFIDPSGVDITGEVEARPMFGKSGTARNIESGQMQPAPMIKTVPLKDGRQALIFYDNGRWMEWYPDQGKLQKPKVGYKSMRPMKRDRD